TSSVACSAGTASRGNTSSTSLTPGLRPWSVERETSSQRATHRRWHGSVSRLYRGWTDEHQSSRGDDPRHIPTRDHGGDLTASDCARSWPVRRGLVAWLVADASPLPAGSGLAAAAGGVAGGRLSGRPVAYGGVVCRPAGVRAGLAAAAALADDVRADDGCSGLGGAVERGAVWHVQVAASSGDPDPPAASARDAACSERAEAAGPGTDDHSPG